MSLTRTWPSVALIALLPTPLAISASMLGGRVVTLPPPQTMTRTTSGAAFIPVKPAAPGTIH